MKNKINIILNQDYPNIGKKGTVNKVSVGYAFNYLIPNKIAEIANSKKIKHYNMFQQIAHKQNEKNYIQASKLQKLLKQIDKISIKKKKGEKYQFFGSINEKYLIQIIKNYTGKTFEKRQLNLPEIKHLGLFAIKINITENIESILKLHLVPDNI